MIRTGRHFLQIPGPTNCPDRVLRAMNRQVIDHRSAEFAALGLEILQGIRPVFGTTGPVIMYPGSGTGAWESGIVNTLSPGDRVLTFDIGYFADLWRRVAQRFGLEVDTVPGNWRRGCDLQQLQSRLAADSSHRIKAVMAVHNETSTGAVSDIAQIRKIMNAARHPALLMVDAVSSLGAMDLRHDEWGIDVTIASSQKGLMLPPGMCFTAISEKALAASKTARLPRSYWDWQENLTHNKAGFFPYTPPTCLLYGLQEALHMLQEEGLQNVFLRHQRHAAATRAAVARWGLDLVCEVPAECSSVVTAVFTPEGHDAEQLRHVILDHFDMSLGKGLAKLQGKAFRIGHLGHFNDLSLLGTLAGIEMGLRLGGVPHRAGGVTAALEYLAPSSTSAKQKTLAT